MKDEWSNSAKEIREYLDKGENMSSSYTQVELMKGHYVAYEWVPTIQASPGKSVMIQEDGQWDDGWTITELYQTKKNKPSGRKVAIVE